MYFTEFKIKNFKGIENIVLPLSSLRKGQIHTLVGLNESGKTTVLEAINAFSDRNSNYEEVLYEGTHKGSSITDYVPKHKKSNFTGVISIQAAIALEKVDIKDLSEYLLKTHDFILNEKKLGEQLVNPQFRVHTISEDLGGLRA